ncbi:LysR family transcriptional regulator [Streptomyces stelliscabiei]|uniref:DNA-binding transcriptional LysR family regulator n=1 Tax=Streptomyces stelliscabiei TaxID=146820 RepID=A0A8I0TQS0_9ACTN|nr:LysR family transcriptional regulator [Streptomyces stelliscabiei]KND41807.1 LysR family transcriptional regulator [Streptomyces stelliscabiei]MBE1594503.1 DNA-binding transcriptional LysR family regulator [Streptomyces stelliscabiei]MDX2518841.1 LysR family transcriptional regulator [Streptomyces stelliscabiei]
MQLDLNLLTVLDALLEEGSVMGAAERLHLSSPAVSRTLGRLRAVTGDDILVRTGHSMTPTPYAVSVREDVHRLVRQAHEVLSPVRELNPAEMERTFTIQCHDAVAASLLPVLVERIQQRASGVQLRVLAESPVDTDDLRHGRVDLELGGGRPGLPEFRSESLGDDPLVVAMRADHPCAAGLDLASYAAQPHVVISRRGRLTAPIDDVLAAEGLRRRVVAAVATVSTALQIAARGDALVTCTAIHSRPLIEAFGLLTRPLPIESPAATINCNWHQRFDSDPAHAWLREQVRASLAEITAR